jgi:hypothetical protein
MGDDQMVIVSGTMMTSEEYASEIEMTEAEYERAMDILYTEIEADLKYLLEDEV